MNKNERVSKWDNYKLFLMLLVVLGHFCGPFMSQSKMLSGLTFFIYGFHIPAFFFVSGMLGKKKINEKNIRAILPYLTLYLFTKLLVFAFSSAIFHNYKLSILTEGGLPWFVLSLFLMNIVTMYLKDYKPVFVIILCVALMVIVGFCSFNSDFLAYMRTINFYIFFYIGYLIEPHKLLEISKSSIVKIVSCLFIVGYIGVSLFLCGKLSFIRLLMSGRNPYSELKELEPYGFVFRILLTIATLIVILAFAVVMPNIRCFITKLGQKTLAIYSFHYIFFYICFRILDGEKMLKHYFGGYWVYSLILIGIILTVLCSNPLFECVVKKIMNYKEKLNEDK